LVIEDMGRGGRASTGGNEPGKGDAIASHPTEDLWYRRENRKGKRCEGIEPNQPSKEGGCASFSGKDVKKSRDGVWANISVRKGKRL